MRWNNNSGMGLIAFLFLSLSFLSESVGTQDDDPIKVDLDYAEKAYTAVVKSAADSLLAVVTTPIQNEIEKFSKVGDLAQVKVADVTSRSAFGSSIASLDPGTNLFLSVAWSPDGAKLASCSKDKTIKIWSHYWLIP